MLSLPVFLFRNHRKSRDETLLLTIAQNNPCTILCWLLGPSRRILCMHIAARIPDDKPPPPFLRNPVEKRKDPERLLCHLPTRK
jgi:hypothetical protein